MSLPYRIEIRHRQRHWATVMVDATASPAGEILADFRQRFPADQGYHLDVQRAQSEHRVLDWKDGLFTVIAQRFEYAPVED